MLPRSQGDRAVFVVLAILVIVAIWYWSDWRFLVAHLLGVAIAYRSGKESTKLDMRELLNIFRRGAADRDPP